MAITKVTVSDIVGDELNISAEERGGTRVVVVGADGLNLWFDKSSAAALGALITRLAAEIPATVLGRD